MPWEQGPRREETGCHSVGMAQELGAGQRDRSGVLKGNFGELAKLGLSCGKLAEPGLDGGGP